VDRFLSDKVIFRELIMVLFILITTVALSYSPKVYRYNPETGLWQRVSQDISEVVVISSPLSGTSNSSVSLGINGTIVVQPSNSLNTQSSSSVTTKAQWYYYIEYQIKDNTTKSYYGVIAGQNYNIGTTTVWNDNSNIHIKFELIGGWLAEQSQLKIDNQKPTGNQNPGQFPYKRTYNPAVSEDEYVIAYLNRCPQVGQKIYILLHLSVKKGNQQETAWAGGEPPSDMCVTISNTGSLWYIRKPGKYTTNAFEVSVNSSYPVVVTFSNFDNLQPQGGIGVEKIDVFYTISDDLPSNFEWITAQSLNSMVLTLSSGSSSLNFYQLVDLKTQSSGIYKNVGTITFTLQNTKAYVDRK